MVNPCALLYPRCYFTREVSIICNCKSIFWIQYLTLLYLLLINASERSSPSRPTPQVIFVTMKRFIFFFVGGGQNISIQLIFSRTYGSLTPTHWETFRNIVSHNLLIWTNYCKHFNFQLDWDIQHIAIVMSPLKSLMADHVNTLQEINIRSNLIESDMSTEAIAVYFFLLCTFPNLQ